MKNMMNFSNKELGVSIEGMEINGRVMFIANDVANMFGFKKPRNAISNHCKGVLLEHTIKRGGYPLKMIPIEDVIVLLAKTQKLSDAEKIDITNWLIYCGLLDCNTVVISSRMEIEFGKQLSDTLAPMDIKVETQKLMFGGKYRIDFYLPQYKLAIEYDEIQHRYSKEADRTRQLEIEKELDCKFVRCPYENTDAYNVGLVIKKIMEEK